MYDLHILGWHSFQQLCLTITREILGQTVESYLDSADAGKDGAFAGIWNPMNGEALNGKFVIQCKFTGKQDKTLKPSDITDDVEKARKLVLAGRCDCYILMTNAGLSGTAAEDIGALFLQAGVKQFRVFGSTWICQQIRENKRLRMMVPRVYGLGDLSQILDERAYEQAKALLSSLKDDLAKVVLTGAYRRAAWKNLGRNVMAGQKGIRILAPIVGVRRKKDEEAQKDITKQNERVLLGFRNAYVFDVSQTDGVDLPQMREVSGDPGENLERLEAFLKSKGIALGYNPNIAPALGMSYGGRIALLPGQSKAEEFSTLVHETAHELLHKAERRTATTKTVRETEAEAVAFVVGKAVGLVTGSASADYIQLYHGNASLLAESLEVIQQTASVILAALEPPIADEAATDELAEVAA
jgi:hypothetical protein